MNENQNNDYKGFSLFNDIEDVELRTRNRAVVMGNIAEDNMNKEKMITAKGASLVLGYFNSINAEDRAGTLQAFEENMRQRGFQIVG